MCFSQKLIAIAPLWCALFFSCENNRTVETTPAFAQQTEEEKAAPEFPPFDTIIVGHDVNIGCLFDFLDTLVAHYDTLTPYPFSEHLFVRANPWLIDTLENTDYYRLKEKGVFNYDNRLLVVMKRGDTLFIPHEKVAMDILAKMQKTILDLNIPELRLRIIEGDSILYSFPVRVGQNKSRFLTATGRVTDLRTQTGKGYIVRHSKDPFFMDPVDGRLFNITKRDDHEKTRMPLIPWIEPELHGKRYGQLIHPTTNPRSLGKAYSNGCIGTSEAAAWHIYYHAPLGTRVVFRYDLQVVNEIGDTLKLKDIYGYSNMKKRG